jgi:hypothetical protein
MKTIQITKEQAKEMYNSGIPSLISIAESNFPEMFITQKWNNFGKIKGYYISELSTIIEYDGVATSSEKNIYPSRGEAERELALIQLRQWRDKANGQPLNEWCLWDNREQTKYGISAYRNSWLRVEVTNSRYELVFKTKEIRDNFINEHNSLIDLAFNIN